MARVAISVGLLATFVGCGMPAMSPRAIEDPTPLAKCQVQKSAASPLVTEWPASEKAHLESLLQSQAVVVAYEGCDLKILEGCRPEGQYAFQRTTLASDTIEITDVGDLYAKLPLGAAALEAELSASGRLAIRTTAVGQVRLADDVTIPKSPACEGATHLVRAISVGAYDMISGGAVAGGAGVSAGPLAAGARRRVEQRQLRSGGVPQRCSQTEDEPHRDCRSPLQMFLTPVVWGEARPSVMNPEPPTVGESEPQASPPPLPDARMSPELADRLLESRPIREQLQQATRMVRSAPQAPAPTLCDLVDVEVVSVTRARPRPLHLPRGGSLVRLKLTNRATSYIDLPGSSALHLTDHEGRSFTSITVPEIDHWHSPVSLPTEASLTLQVVVGPNLRVEDLAAIRVHGLHGEGDPFNPCDLRVDLPAPDAP